MQIRACIAKIHRATVTDANLHYIGSITIDPDILAASGLKPFQMVIINNVSNAASWQTYIVAGRKNKGEIILNGPPALLFKQGDKVIIVAEAYIEPTEWKDFKSTMVFVDDENKVTKVVVRSVNDANQEFNLMKESTGFIITYTENSEGLTTVAAVTTNTAPIEIIFPYTAIDEAHILYRQLCELLKSRSNSNKEHEEIRNDIEKLIAHYRNDGKSPTSIKNEPTKIETNKEFVANPGKKLNIDVDGVTYQRLPIKTRIITTEDKDILKLMDQYVKPHLRPDDIIFISEKALTVTQGRIINMSDIKTTAFARFLARNVKNQYGKDDFHGFGHGTDMAMQLLIEEAGYPRAFFAAAVSAITRPFGIRGLFYQICGPRAKSIDCPMSFLILEYAHFAKLAPNDPTGAAKSIKEHLGNEVVILDANYRGAFSLGKSTHKLSEAFIQALFKDNPLGQSDEMTPFCIVRKTK